jgi:hypothetical protein
MKEKREGTSKHKTKGHFCILSKLVRDLQGFKRFHLRRDFLNSSIQGFQGHLRTTLKSNLSK